MRPEVELLTKRVDRLERENRLLKGTGAGTLLGLIVLLCAGAATKPRTIEAEKIIIRDSHGRARVTIGTPAFAGTTVDTKSDDPVIWLTDDKGADRAMLTADGLRFGNGQERPLVELSSDPRPGGSTLRFYGPDGKVSWSAP
jgi:hypothetical protein